MKLLNAIISGFIALLLLGWVSMAGIFAGAAMSDNPMTGNVIMYGGLLSSLTIAVLHVWGQIKYWKTPKGEKARVPLIMMYAGIPLAILLFVGVLLTFEILS